jgi:hypothetical protein
MTLASTLSERATVGCLPAEDIVVLASRTTWQVPWELMMRGPFAGCGLLDGHTIRHITVPSMIASAARRLPTPGAILEPGDYPVLPVFSSDTSLFAAAVDIMETGWDLAIVLDDEPRAISALSVYRALLAEGTAGGLEPRVLLGDR